MYPTLYRHTCAHTQTHGKAEIGIHPLKFKDDTFSLSQMFLDHPMSPIPVLDGSKRLWKIDPKELLLM